MGRGEERRGEERRGEVYTGLWWGKPEGKSQLGRPKRRWKNTKKMDL